MPVDKIQASTQRILVPTLTQEKKTSLMSENCVLIMFMQTHLKTGF